VRRFDRPRNHVGDCGIFEPLRSDRFESNIYVVLDPARQPWAWRGGDRPLGRIRNVDWAVSLLRGPPLDLRITETAFTREWSPSLIVRLFTWVRTVEVLIPRRDAILVVECPSVGASMTSISRGVSRESRLSTSGRSPDPGFSRPFPSACWPRSER